MSTMTPQRRYDSGELGFYVQNPKTKIVGAGPFHSFEEADAFAERENATPPIAPDLLNVVQLVDEI